MRTLITLPIDDNFYMPGEFEKHRGGWLLWPERCDTWRLGAKPAQKVFAKIATILSEYEEVTVGVSKEQYANARLRLPEKVRVVELSYNDAWLRDSGPIFLKNKQGELRGVHWDFNSWGGINEGLYFPWDQDLLVPQKILEIDRVDRYRAKMVLEGGAIQVDGQGTLIATEECVLNPNRNAMPKAEVETYLKSYINVKKIIWLKKGLYLDETDGHVDNICCFIRPAEVVLNWTDEKDDPQYAISMEAFETLRLETDALGRKITVHKIHQPGPLFIEEGETEDVDDSPWAKPRKAGDRLPASYINFYLTNGALLLPQYDDKYDKVAEDIFTKLLPERKIIPISSREILLAGGSIHCILQQIPL